MGWVWEGSICCVFSYYAVLVIFLLLSYKSNLREKDIILAYNPKKKWYKVYTIGIRYKASLPHLNLDWST